ncbi:MAG: hypothetical protein QXE66_07010 [Desulfurococcaceae archaeon]
MSVVDPLALELVKGIARNPRLVVHVCSCVLAYQLLRNSPLVIRFVHHRLLPFFVVILMASYIALAYYLRRGVVDALMKVAEEGFSVKEVPELLERFQERCFMDDARSGPPLRLGLVSITCWLLYYFSLFLAVCLVGHYEVHYGRPPISTLLFDTYALYTSAFTAGGLYLSAFLAYAEYDKREATRGDTLFEWIKEVIEDYAVNNCLRKVCRGSFSRILAIFAPLIPFFKTELLRPISVPPLPVPLASYRISTLVSTGRYSIKSLKGEEVSAEQIIPNKPLTIEELKSGLANCVTVVKVYENGGGARGASEQRKLASAKEFLGYLIAYTTSLDDPSVALLLRHVEGKRHVSYPKAKTRLAHIYLLALRPRMAKFYIDMLVPRYETPQRGKGKRKSTT